MGWLRFLGMGDATSGQSGHVFSLGFRLAVPIFNWNQGAIGRAEVERERAIRQLHSIRERAMQEVRQAHALHAQAVADYRQWTADIRPAVDEAVRRAENTYKEGGASLLLVLETSRQLIDARLREAQLRADLARTWAELERSVGRKIGTSGFAADRLEKP
jgi:outer membrane protein TolC